MVQNQLVDYIGTQMKAGISREAIKSALVGVGWQAADVEDSLKKVENDAKPAGSWPVAAVSPAVTVNPATTPAQVRFPQNGPVATNPASRTSFSPMDLVNSGAAKPAATAPSTQAKTPATQPIKMSDFMGGTTPVASTMAGKFEKIASVAPGNVAAKPVTHKGERISMAAEGIGLIALAALTIYLYSQNSILSSKVGAVNTASTGVSAQLSTLQGQVQTLTGNNGTLQSQATDLTAQVSDLTTQLSFFAALTGAPTTTPATLAGTVTTSVNTKGVYAIKTQYGAVIFVKNSSDPKVAAILKPLVGTSATLAGSYLPGSDALTVATVNGNPVNPPAPTPVATPTPATPPAAATSTP
jgi:hypothetical protein